MWPIDNNFFSQLTLLHIFIIVIANEETEIQLFVSQTDQIIPMIMWLWVIVLVAVPELSTSMRTITHRHSKQRNNFDLIISLSEVEKTTETMKKKQTNRSCGVLFANFFLSFSANLNFSGN